MATEDNGRMLYCICRTEYHQDEFMIECDKCKDWFHGRCVGICEDDAQYIDMYHCPSCVKQHGPLKLKKKYGMQKQNYLELNHGIKPIFTGTKDFIQFIKKRKFADIKNNIVVLENGYFFSHEFLEVNGFTVPVLVEKSDGLGLVLPPRSFTVYDVEKHVGSMREIHVIDVAKQEDIRMRMREWTEYYNCPIRTKVLNVISLEFSNTKLSQLVSAPSVVRDISWVENVWPENVNDESPSNMPYVQKYCLMGVKDCYTDFHIDFGGTSVWYHVLRGEKLFYLIEPTDENLTIYENWVSSPNQNKIFFGDQVSKCIQCTVKEGQTLFIPTGWIHAVMTPIDTLVFGGNFLHSLNIELQLKIYDLEHKLNTPIKYLFPNYETTCWYTARAISKKVKEFHSKGRKIPKFLFKGLVELIKYLKIWTYNKEEYLKFHKFQVPFDISPLKLIKSLDKELKNDVELEASQFNTSSKISGVVMSDSKDKKNEKTQKPLSKTVIKLKLTGPHPNREMESVIKKKSKSKRKRVGSAKKRKVKQNLSVSEGGDCKQRVRKGRLKLENKNRNERKGTLKAGNDPFRSDISKLKLISDPVSHENQIKISTQNDKHIGDNPQNSKSMQYEYQDWEAAQLLSNFHGMDTRTRSDLVSDPEYVGAQLLTANDLNETGTEKKEVVEKYTPESMRSIHGTKQINEDDSDDGYRISLPLITAKKSVKRNLSESDSDYDPSEEFYQDANYVYPRLATNADLDDDDFAWNPSQRKRKKSKKLLKQTSKLNTQRRHKKLYSEVIENFEEKIAKKSRDQCAMSSSLVQLEQDKKKDKFRRGQATAKQRLGKLLKMDKLGGRYLR